MTAKNKSEVPRVHFLMKKKIDWDKPKKGLLNSINAISQTIIQKFSVFKNLRICAIEFCAPVITGSYM